MYVDDCIFCKISKGEIPSVKIWEDNNFLAILDLFPNTVGMTLVIPKKHYDSDLTEMGDKPYTDLLLAAKNVSAILKKALSVEKVAMVVEGLGVNHAHVKLYPLYDTNEGYITTELGTQKTAQELEKIAQKIRSKD